LLQPQSPGRTDPVALQEFSELARSAGATVVGSLAARVERPNPRYFVGSGKAEELKAQKLALDADLILVNHTLTPVQERNLEQLTECRVVDRTGLILDIFAQRARSHEGKLQVELAQLKHMSTRLVRGWTHLERQRGGSIGLRGPGETQLELDRRLLGDRVKQLQKRMKKVETQRAQARRGRQRNELPVVALVGYTNAGKSTLFNALTGATVYVADQLFATLDPTLRRLDGLDCGPLVLADTVGFIRDLPHDLVAAFRSTLAEARDADLLLHVVDASDPERHQHMADVETVLAEIGAENVPQVLVYNKIDLIHADVKAGENSQAPAGGHLLHADARLGEDHEAAILGHTSQVGAAPVGTAPRFDGVNGGGTPRAWVSALSAAGIDGLLRAIGERLGSQRVRAEFHVPAAAGRLRARLHARGVVAEERADDIGWHIRIDAPLATFEPLFGLPDGDGDWLRAKVG
jgi:GTP-binding protein HflX